MTYDELKNGDEIYNILIRRKWSTSTKVKYTCCGREVTTRRTTIEDRLESGITLCSKCMLAENQKRTYKTNTEKSRREGEWVSYGPKLSNMEKYGKHYWWTLNTTRPGNPNSRTYAS